MNDKDFEVLKSTFVFNGVNDDFLLNNVIPCGVVLTALKNTEFSFEEKFKNSLTVILKGEAVVYKKSDDRMIFMSLLSAGDVFGMASMFCDDESFETVIIAVKNCKVFCLPQNNFEKIITDNSLISINYIKLLSKKVHYLNRKLDLYSSSTVNSKFAVFLLDSLEKDGKTVILNKSLSKTAVMLNIGRASLYRAMEYFEQNGAIIKNGNNIEIVNIDKLLN